MSGKVPGVGLALMIALAAGCRTDPRTKAMKATGGDPARGAQAIERYGCAACHTIEGIEGAKGTMGPSLEGIATRPKLSGDMPNTPDNLIRWIEKPQDVKKDSQMPDMGVTEQDARDIAAHLYAPK